MADYFGIEKYSPAWFDLLGVSVILVNSPQGAALFAQCRQDLHTEERPKEETLNDKNVCVNPPPCLKTAACFGRITDVSAMNM